jgi:hypothetical protein
MRQRLPRRVLRRPWLTAGFVAALALTLVFVLRLALGALHWSEMPDAQIEGWMPVGMVAQSWDVPRDLLAEAIGIPPGTAPRRSLAWIAEARGEDVDALIARIEAAIASHRAAATGDGG